MAETDLELIREFARTRSEAVFRSLVERNVSTVHAVAFRITRRHDLAQDVCQLVFVKRGSSG